MKKNINQLIKESSLGRFIQHVQNNENIAFITSDRSENGKSENKKNLEELKKLVEKAGFGYNKIVGGFIETREDTTKLERVEENSLIVYSEPKNEQKLKQFSIDVGVKYKQQAILFVPKSIDADGLKRKVYSITTKNYTDDKGTKHSIGEEEMVGDSLTLNKIEDYFSKLGKHKFAFIKVDPWAKIKKIVNDKAKAKAKYIAEYANSAKNNKTK